MRAAEVALLPERPTVLAYTRQRVAGAGHEETWTPADPPAVVAATRATPSRRDLVVIADRWGSGPFQVVTTAWGAPVALRDRLDFAGVVLELVGRLAGEHPHDTVSRWAATEVARP